MIMVSGNSLEDDRLQHWLFPVDRDSGDAIAAARAPDDTLYLLHADASGHGLTAAISVHPVLALFERLVAQGTPVGEIAGALNHELRRTLENGWFVAAAIVSITPGTNVATLWHGGTPDILHLGAEGTHKAWYGALQTPLGISDFDEEMATVRTIPLAPGDQLVLFSDGLSEARDANGTELGNEQVARMLVQSCGTDQIEAMKIAVSGHVGESQPHDDVSLLIFTHA
jgi:serine phosphatase RsbU (regulator of sigma subunit)